jgi:hypothetical protein
VATAAQRDREAAALFAKLDVEAAQRAAALAEYEGGG